MNRKKVYLQLFFVVSALLFGYAATELRFDNDASGNNLIPKNEIETYSKYNAPFQQDYEGAILLLERKNSWLEKDALQWLEKISFEIPNATSIVTLFFPTHSGFSISSKRVLNPNNNESIDQFIKHKSKIRDITGKFLSQDEKIALIYLENDSAISNSYLNKLQSSEIILSANLLGSKQFIAETSKTTKRDLRVTGFVSLLLVALCFFWLTRSIKSVIISSLIILYNLIWIAGLSALIGIEIGPQMIAIPVLITVMSFSDIMHLLFTNQTIKAANQLEVKTALVQRLKKPLFYTSLTNAIGFILYLILAENQVLFELGIVGIIGIVISFLAARHYLLTYLSCGVNYSIDANIITKIQSWHKRTLAFLKKKRFAFLTLYLGLFFSAIMIVSFSFEIEGTRSTMYTPETSFGKAQEQLTSNFFGDATYEIYIDYDTETELMDASLFDLIQLIEKRIDSIYKPLYQDSPLTVMRRYNRFQKGGYWDAFELPKSLSSNWMKGFIQYRNKLGWETVVQDNRIRIQWGVYGKTMHESFEDYEALNGLLTDFKTKNKNINFTGKQWLQDKSEYRFVIYILSGFGVIILIAGLIMRNWIGSVKNLIIFIIINLAPLVMAMALMLLFGIPFNSISIFMLSVLLGLCLDDSIYMLTFKRNQENIIYPIVVTTLVLITAAFAFSFSSFSWMRPFAIIFALSFFIALISDIFALPILLTNIDSEEND